MTERQIHKRNITRLKSQIDALTELNAETFVVRDRLTGELESERFALLMLDAPAVGGTVDVRFYGLEAA